MHINVTVDKINFGRSNIGSTEDHWGMMRGGSSGKIGGIGPGDAFSYTIGHCASINHEGCHCSTDTMRPYSRH
jgi:hypothetical protein